ncbi:MAG: hypothetical protein J5615_07440 [Fibrobacter sp.]|nr:hypothetical protein [Fibrobacter sp.]
MFYKHIEKFAIALTSLFWASCGDTISVAGGDNNSTPEYSSSSSEFRMSSTMYGIPFTSSSIRPESSSSAESSSSELRMSVPVYGVPSTSSSIRPKSSSSTESSSSVIRMSVPAYGVPSTSSSSELRMSSTLYGITYNCFNTTENNAEGVEFEIIECGQKSGDGILESTKKKYLRNPYDATKDTPLPDGVQVFAPRPGSLGAKNCTSESDICIERNPNIPVEQDSLAGCHPIIDCPEKPN